MDPRENALLAYQHKQPAYIPCFFTDMSTIQAYPQGERYAGHESGTDWFGVDWTYVPEMCAPMPTPGKELFDDVADWEKYVKFPDLDAIDWKAQAEIDINTDFMAFVAGAGLIPRQDGKTAYDDGKLVLDMNINGPFERMHSLMGMQNALAGLLLEPEASYELIGALTDHKIRYYEKIAQYYQVDVMNQHDDYGTSNSMFMSVDTWRKLIKPHLTRLVEAAHDLGFIYQHHSCGYVEPLIDDLVEIGVDALDTLQSCNTNIRAIKDRLQDRLTFCGGFNNIEILDVAGMDAGSIKQEYHRVIDSLAPGGSYVIFPITATLNWVPPFLEEHFSYGMGFYAQEQAQKEVK